jgi:hypothetical protein
MAEETLTQNSIDQYGRDWTLLVVSGTVENGQSEAIDLSQLRIKFVVKRSNIMTPNIADIRVYNLNPDTALRIKKEFKAVIFEAGYVGNRGVIFKGNIKQVIIGRESATDTFVDIIAGDGDRAFNFAIMKSSIAAGVDLKTQVKEAIKSMNLKGVTEGFLDSLPDNKLPRGKVFYGNASDILRTLAQTGNSEWSIQDEKVNLVKRDSFLPGAPVKLNVDSGMIGTPQQTNEGVNVKCLLNPNIKVGGRIEINNSSIARLKIDLSVAGTSSNLPALLSNDGNYFVLVAEHSGDTRGVDWYTSMVCLIYPPGSNPYNNV